VEKCLGCSVSVVLLLEDLLPDILALVNQVLDVLVDFGLVLVLNALPDVLGVVSSFLEFFVGIN